MEGIQSKKIRTSSGEDLNEISKDGPSETEEESVKNKRSFRDFSISHDNFATKISQSEVDTILPVLKKIETEDKKSEEEKFETNEDDMDFEIIEKDAGKSKDKSTDDVSVAATPPPNTSLFVDAAIKDSQKLLTENASPCYSTAGDARVDFFLQVLEDTNSEKTNSLLTNSWKQNSLHTLKLVAYLRDIRGGKGIRKQYHECLYWMYLNHPRTLYENLEQLMKFGYWKDSLQMLMTIAFDGFIHPHLANDDAGKSKSINQIINDKKRKRAIRINLEEKEAYNNLIKSHYKCIEPETEGFIKNTKMKHFPISFKLKYAREKFKSDKKYQIFHVRIAKIFAQQLKSDLEVLKSNISTENKNKNISLAAKWAPSLEKHFDNYTLIASTVAVELAQLLKDTKSNIINIKNVALAVYLSRKFYHKEYCVPLRRFFELPEISMSAEMWQKVKYNRVASKCMKRNVKVFTKHDGERFREYLVRKGSKVAGATLKPIELIRTAMNLGESSSQAEILVMEKQWTSLVDDIKSKGKSLLKNAVCVCDVSGSMQGDPMLAAMGLTLISMSMCDQPWNSVCVTFSGEPEWHHLAQDLSLMDKVNSLKGMKWGYNTDIQKVFNLILSMGMKNKLTEDQMPQVILVFTDMEFDCAFPGTTETNFQAAKTLFQTHGYSLPAIIFWNLRSSASTPVQMDEQGTMLLSGFSAQQLTYIMEQKTKEIAKSNPLKQVLDIVEKARYKNLAVFD